MDKLNIIKVAVELHEWLKNNENDEILTKKVRIISENLDAIINEHKLYK